MAMKIVARNISQEHIYWQGYVAYYLNLNFFKTTMDIVKHIHVH